MYGLHLLQPQAYDEIVGRLEKLSPQNQALWGKMDVAQMLAHVTGNLKMTMSEEKVTQTLLGRIFGRVAKRQILTKGVTKNIPTSPNLVIADRRQFQKERETLRLQLERFVNGGEAGITRQPHDFFGRLTPNEWARLQYVHMDHHLRQFGV